MDYFGLHPMYCIFPINLPNVTLENPLWQIQFSLANTWQAIQPWQHHHFGVVTWDWKVLLATLAPIALRSTYPSYYCLYLLYWIFKYLALTYSTQVVYVLCTITSYWVKWLASESRLFGPYDSKAWSQNAFGHRMGHNQFILVADFIRIKIAVFGLLILFID